MQIRKSSFTNRVETGKKSECKVNVQSWSWCGSRRRWRWWKPSSRSGKWSRSARCAQHWLDASGRRSSRTARTGRSACARRTVRGRCSRSAARRARSCATSPARVQSRAYHVTLQSLCASLSWSWVLSWSWDSGSSLMTAKHTRDQQWPRGSGKW